jgi:hypothetical protein
VRRARNENAADEWRAYLENRHRRIRANAKDMQLYTELRKELQALTGLVPLKTEPGSE